MVIHSSLDDIHRERREMKDMEASEQHHLLQKRSSDGQVGRQVHFSGLKTNSVIH